MELQGAKLQKMIKDYLKIENPTKNEIIQFNTLRKALESIEKEISKPLVNLNPPKLITIIKPKTVNINIKVKKDANMNACITEMLSNELFLMRQELCEAI